MMGALRQRVGEHGFLRSAAIRCLDHRVLPKPVRCRAAGWGAANGVERRPVDLNVCQCVFLTCGFVRSCRSGPWPDQVDAEVVAQRRPTALNGVEVQVKGMTAKG